MVGWIVLCLALFLVGVTRVGVTAGYRDGAPVLAVHIGFFTLRIPASGKDKPEIKEMLSVKGKEEKDKKSLFASYHMGKVIQAAFRAAARLLHSIHVRELYFSFTAGSADAARTAVQYGNVCAVVSGILPLIRQKGKIRKEKVWVSLDYTLPSPQIEGVVTLTVRIGVVLGIGILFLLDLWNCCVPEDKDAKVANV